ncbi:MAG: hypothetical protein IJR86_01055 [Bacteroidaceae bacterium]|nr:hypothetical protein [Bacteroidaceae bacterium]
MKQEEKELLLKALCGYFPYGVICTDNRHGDSRITEININPETVYYYDFDEYGSIECCRPYLRTMESMTEDERCKYKHLINEYLASNPDSAASVTDWLNKTMFDYRGLIPMGLAIEVTKRNNPYK